MVLFGQEHMERYVATDGEEGHDWRGTQTLILTTTGHRSGEQRSTPLIYGRHGDDYMVVASKGGSDEPPAWYRNLKAKPEVRVQVWGERFAARARDATPEEKPELWPIMTAEWPAYDDYQEKTEREIRWWCWSASTDAGGERPPRHARHNARAGGGPAPGRRRPAEPAR